MATSVSYNPAPHEQGYYEALFQAADVQRSNNIGGGQAVAFFSKSKLQVETLRNIWTLSDQNPTTNSLDRRKFAVAIRLIQLAQNGVKAQGTSLGAPPGSGPLRPAFFEGVSGVAIPMPPPEGSSAPSQQSHPSQNAVGLQQQPPSERQPPATAQMGVAPVSPHPQSHAVPPISQAPTQAPVTPTPPVMSTALTVQDPYTMTPQEQSRYDDLFPQYQKPDGFVYGKEAVDLFSKSGVPQDQLGKIWNMVDAPVDNRLDKLEFAMAMHMIVCVSKKNLPLPSSLPFSLKQMKSQDAEATTNASRSAVPEEAQQWQHPTTQASLSTDGPPPLPTMNGVAPLPLGGAPTLSPPGGMSISDAFDDLDPTDTSYGQGGFTSSSGGLAASDGPPSFPSVAGAAAGYAAGIVGTSELVNKTIVETVEDDDFPTPAPMQVPASTMRTVLQPVDEPKTTEQLKNDYIMGDEASELAKLKATLQKLQAENISLKAQMGAMTEDEKDVQKEISATVAEIGKLSNDLTTLRAQVLASKSRLLESTAELKAAQEKKQVITDLIGEASSTKDALEQANVEIAEQADRAASAPPAPAPISYENDLFGFDAATPTMGESTPPGEPYGVAAAAPALEANLFGAEQTQTPGSSMYVAPVIGAPPQTTDAFSGIPDPQPSASYGAFGSSAAPPMSEFASMSMGGAPSTTAAEPNEFGDGLMGGVMGSGGGGFGTTDEPTALSAGAFSHTASQQASMTTEEVETMKKQAIKAEQNANEAQDTFQQLAAQADKLRSAADNAEMDARSKQAKASEKAKKKGFGGRGKKKEMKDAEQAAIDAATKKKAFLEMQTQANNAQTVAMESKREAERLRHQAEQAELDMAAAASAAEAHAKDMANTQAAMEKSGAPQTNGFQDAHPPAQYGGFEDVPTYSAPPPVGYGGGGHVSDGKGFGVGGAMGGVGGASYDGGIPSPQQGNVEIGGPADPYANPF